MTLRGVAVLSLLALCLHVAAAQRTVCRHIKVKVDGESPATVGWRLVDHLTGKTIDGVAPGNYTTTEANHVQCYQVKVPTGTRVRLELLSSDSRPWADGYVAVMNSSACLHVARTSTGSRALWFKPRTGAVLRTSVLSTPLSPCVNKPRTPTQRLPDMMPIASYLVQTLVGQQEFCWSANETRATSPQKYCEREESGIKVGCWQVVRFGVGIGNFGTGPLVLGDPRKQLDTGLYEYATCHAHYHWKGFAAYELYDPLTGRLWQAAKRGFCANDIKQIPFGYMKYLKGKRPVLPVYNKCGDIDNPGDQGVSVGYMDVYGRTIPGQFFILDGGDRQPVLVPERLYYIRITANPGFWPGTRNYRCITKDYHGLCHPFAELDYDNNVIEVPFYYTEQ